jgi:transcriptional regulator
MYQPKKYLKKDPDFIFQFIHEHPFATLVVNGNRLLATHIPILVKGSSQEFTLYSHVANHNDLLQFLKDGAEALLIFQGAHGYVSSSWYKEKEISTWDYSAVHINVKIKLQTRDELLDSLTNLVNRFEKYEKDPLFLEELPKEMVEENLAMITGFWCEPFKVEAVAKLHQGFDKEDIDSVIEHLEERKDDPLSCPLSKNIRKENSST